MIQRIDQLTQPPVIGRHYLVPTVRYPFRGKVNDWPVIGPRHEDAEIIGFPDNHYHLDGRFLSLRQVDLVAIDAPGYDGLEYGVAGRPLCYASNSLHPDPHPPVIWRRRLCRRHLGYPTEIAMMLWLPQLIEAYAGHILGPHRICPHRGAPLASIKPDDHGVVTCPLHGLRWRADGTLCQ